MGKPQAAKKPTTERHARAARAANAHRDAKPENVTMETLVGAWHVSYVERERWKARSELDGGKVKEAMKAAGVLFVATPDGTPTLVDRAGATKIDWESLARAHLDRDVLERELPRFTSVGAPSVALNPPKEWSLQAKPKSLTTSSKQ